MKWYTIILISCLIALPLAFATPVVLWLIGRCIVAIITAGAL